MADAAPISRSRDHRVQAEAKGLLGVVALYKDDKPRAVESFSSAADLDPANSEIVLCAKELSSGTHNIDRVAKTAARMFCHKKKKQPDSGNAGKPKDTKGVLARGLFSNYKEYSGALKKARQDRSFTRSYNSWIRWECR